MSRSTVWLPMNPAPPVTRTCERSIMAFLALSVPCCSDEAGAPPLQAANDAAAPQPVRVVVEIVEFPSIPRRGLATQAPGESRELEEARSGDAQLSSRDRARRRSRGSRMGASRHDRADRAGRAALDLACR